MMILSNDAKNDHVRLHREILRTLRILNPSLQIASVATVVTNTLKSLSAAGIKGHELTRMTLAIAQKSIREFPPGKAIESKPV